MKDNEKVIDAMQLAFGLLAQAICAETRAMPVRLNLMDNYKAAMKEHPENPTFDKLMTGPLLTLSSLAVKQEPNDPLMQELYRGLRDMQQRH